MKKVTKSTICKSANQRAHYEGRSEAFKQAHKASKGFIACAGKVVLTNYQKCILHGVDKSNEKVIANTVINNPKDIAIDFTMF
jgi:hypothetical protein